MSDILGLMPPDAAERLTVELARRANGDRSAAAAAELPKIEGKVLPQKSNSGRIFNRTLIRQILDVWRPRWARATPLPGDADALNRKTFSAMARMAASRILVASPRLSRGLLRRCLAAAAGLRCALATADVCLGRSPRGRIRSRARRRFPSTGGYARLVLKLAEDVASEVTTRRLDPRDPLRASGRYYRRPAGRIRARLCRLRAPRSRRHRDPPVAGAPGDRSTPWRPVSAPSSTCCRTAGPGRRRALPIEVVRELAERARAAERALRQQRAEAQAKKRPPIRVRALVQPTFVRFVFEMPDGVGASSMLQRPEADAVVQRAAHLRPRRRARSRHRRTSPRSSRRSRATTRWSRSSMIGDVDVHSFREDKNYNHRRRLPAVGQGEGAGPADRRCRASAPVGRRSRRRKRRPKSIRKRSRRRPRRPSRAR